MLLNPGGGNGSNFLSLLQILMSFWSQFILIRKLVIFFKTSLLFIIPSIVQIINLISINKLWFSIYIIANLLFQGLIIWLYSKSGFLLPFKMSPSSENTIDEKSVIPGLTVKILFSTLEYKLVSFNQF